MRDFIPPASARVHFTSSSGADELTSPDRGTERIMGSSCQRHFALFCSLVYFISSFRSAVESYPNPLTDCDDYGDYIQGSSVLSTLCGVEWRNQDQVSVVHTRVFSVCSLIVSARLNSLTVFLQEQIQNVFKRFLFHYSKAHNSVGSVEREAHSVHPLMRLSPKLSLRRKKQQVWTPFSFASCY
ncbi:Neuromedin-S [Labeo rohita]|uniref:Neuromedin-S n=1 Tax=Labeo rohita TaxID=84645 RepID=A0ABQ8MDL0_LABRO|nr:Neuromedin-S [Labeo rohita]